MASSDPWIGKNVGDYHLEKLIGEGAMGGVYLARHNKQNQMFAVKILSLSGHASADGLRYKKRFKREAKWACLLEHPNIVRVYTSGEYKGKCYLVMELIQGQTLHQILEQKTSISALEALQVARQITSALQAAHKKKIIHRDIKPANIIFAKDGTIKLADFGLAKAMDAMATISQAGQIIGTIYYMSPEQTMGSKKIDHRADFYSLGITLFESLTGKLPYPGRTPIQVIQQHISAPVPSLRDYLPHIQPEINALVRRLMSKKPEERFSDASELLAAIEHCQENFYNRQAGNRLGNLGARMWRCFRSWAMTLTLIGALLFAGMLLYFTSSITNARPKPSKPQPPANHGKPPLHVNQGNHTPPPGATKTAPHTGNQQNPAKFLQISPADNDKIYQRQIKISGRVQGKNVALVKIGRLLTPCRQLTDNLFAFSNKIELIPGHNQILLQAISNCGDILGQKQISLSLLPANYKKLRPIFSIAVATLNQRDERTINFQTLDTIIIQIDITVSQGDSNHSMILRISGSGPGKVKPISKNLGKVRKLKTSMRQPLSLTMAPGRYRLDISLHAGAVSQQLVYHFQVEKISTTVASLELQPREVYLTPGEKVRFAVKAFNRERQQVPFQPYWIPSGGILSKTGVYVAGSQPGNYIVLVRDKATWSEDQAIVHISSRLDDAGWYGEKMPPGMKVGQQLGEYIWTKDNSIMVHIPTGYFWMGDNRGREDEKPAQKIFVDAFYLDKYELRWQQYLEFCNQTGYKRPPTPPWGIKPQHPVVNISWQDAVSYAHWSGKRLPGEAEWEKAAKGAFKVPAWDIKQKPLSLMLNPYPRRIYPWGDHLPYANSIFYCNYAAREDWKRRGEDGYIHTAPIGSFPEGASPYQCMDMAGNVWEWCQDSYQHDFYRNRDKTNLLNRADIPQRVVRGGSYFNYAAMCRASKRYAENKEDYFPWVGVRLAK